MKNPNRLLTKIRTAVNGNLRETLREPKSIIPPIPKRILPSNSPFRLLYNETYFNYYAGLYYSALSTGLVMIERISRVMYHHFIPAGRSTELGNILLEMKAFFGRSRIANKNSLVILIDDMNNFRDKIRNLLLHGKIEQYLHSTVIAYPAVNVQTLRREVLEIPYNERLHGQEKARFLMGRMALDSYNLLLMITIIFDRYHDYLTDELP